MTSTWYQRSTDDPERNFEILWKMIRDWIATRRHKKLRQEALQEYFPCLVVGSAGSGRGQAAKGKSKGERKGICYQWREE